MTEAEHLRGLIDDLQNRLALLECPEWLNTEMRVGMCYHPDVVKGRVPACVERRWTPYEASSWERDQMWVAGYLKGREPKKCPVCGIRQTMGGLWVQEEPAVILMPNDPAICPECRV